MALKIKDDSKDNIEQGLYQKYLVERRDKSPKHELCEYFVLDLFHDPFAKPALEAYIEACKEKHPTLAEDLAYELALIYG
jgi:hypothetical protein